MSTETTNKKIKIDNGTTFGRTYTDKAVDELLKNARGGISVIELTDKNGTIASAQLGKINANPQNFAFKYNGKILLFTGAGSTTYQYCNNTTSSSDNNVMTTSTLLTIESSTGVYTIAENVHNVVANSIHPVNGGDLTNIQVGSKVYSIPSGGGSGEIKTVSVDAETMTWDASHVNFETDKIINSTTFGIMNLIMKEDANYGYSQIDIFYDGTHLDIPSYILKLDGSVEYNNISLLLDKDNYENDTCGLYIISSNGQKAFESLNLPALPTDAASKTYTLKAVNGVLKWVE